MKEITGKLSASGMKFALVASRFNSFLVEQLVKGAEDAFVRLGGKATDLTLVRVPGAYESPVVAAKLAKSGKFDAVVVLGAVIQGATPHAALINETTARAFARDRHARAERDRLGGQPGAGRRALRHEAGQQGFRGCPGRSRGSGRSQADLSASIFVFKVHQQQREKQQLWLRK